LTAMEPTPRMTPHIDLRANLHVEPDLLLFLSGAYMISAALFSAVELGVFDDLERSPKSLAELASALGVPASALDRLLVVLHSLGLVEHDETGRHRNRPTASALLVRSSATNMCSFLLHQQRHIYPLYGHLSAALRSGHPQTSRWSFAVGSDDRDGYQTMIRAPEECRLFLEAMNTAAAGVGDVIAARVDFSQIRTLLDFGGGGGQIAIELARKIPQLSIRILDTPQACAFAGEVIAHHDLGERVSTVTADFLGDLPGLEPVDAVLLGGVLADWDAEQRQVLLRNAHRCLRPGGTLLVSETLLDETNDGPLLPALLSLTMLVGARGKNFTPSEITDIVRDAGFSDVRVFHNRRHGVRDLVVATR